MPEYGDACILTCLECNCDGGRDEGKKKQFLNSDTAGYCHMSTGTLLMRRKLSFVLSSTPEIVTFPTELISFAG